MKKIKALIAGSAYGLPMLALAQTATDLSFFNTLITQVQDIITALVPVIIGLAVLVFLWGVLKFVTSAGDEAARASGRSFMIWGIVGIFVMVSLWGLVNFLGDILSLDNSAGQAPGLPTPAP